MGIVSQPKQITSSGDRPTFSPGGDQVAYHVQDGNDVSLWIVGSDGGEPRLLYPPEGTPNPRASRPDWSWSDTIAFTDGGVIWTINPDGSDAKPYVGGGVTLPRGVAMSYPSWYKDLQAIAAVGYSGNLTWAEIYRLTPDSVESLTTSPNPCAGRPTVSPDGTRIAFAGNGGVCSQGENQIWLVEPPGAPYRLEPGSPTEFQGRSPNWSPDGDLILIESTRPSTDPTTAPLHLWVVQSDGKNPQPLGLRGVHAEWNRQQTQIVYSARNALYIVDWEPDGASS